VSFEDRLLELVRKRERLLAQCDAQRAALAGAVDGLQTPLSVADRVLDAARFLRRHPVVLGGVIAAAVVVERRGLWHWAQRGFVAWRTYRALRQAWVRLAA